MKKNIHIQYGFFTSMLLITIIIALYLSKINLSGTIQMGVVVGLILGGVVASCFAFKKANLNATNNEVFFNGFRTTAIIGIAVVAFAFLFIMVVPDFKNNFIENFRLAEIGAANNDATKLKEVDANVAQYRSRFNTLFIGLNMMVVVISGLVGSVIGAIMSKNVKP
jgi:MFS family permease